MSGKTLGLGRRGIQSGHEMVVLPPDHGVTCGPIRGLEQPERTIRVGAEGNTKRTCTS